MLCRPRTPLDDTLYDLEDEQSGSKPKRPGLPIEPRRVLKILRDQQTLFLKTLAVAAVVSLILSFFIPRTYESTAQLLYEGTPLLDEGQRASDPGAFIDSAMSSSQLREVREQLGWGTSLKALKAQLKVTLEGKASMNVVATAGDAEEAQALSQTVVDVFLARQASYNANRLRTLLAETERALERATARRETALKEHESFRTESGKTHLLQDQERLLERVTKLRGSADEAAVEVAAQKARIEELKKSRRELPRQVIASATVGTPIDEPLAKARADLATSRATLSEEHPRVQALQQRVRSLEKQRRGQPNERGDQTMVSNPARDEVEKDLATASAALAAAQEREAALRVLVKTVKAEADSLAPSEGEARQVRNALKVADEHLEELTVRATQLQDASVGEMTGFRILSVPPLPEEANPSIKSVLILALLPVLAVFILAIVLIASRLRTLALETPRELAWWGKGPVLGTSVWPRDPAALEPFVAELEDHGVRGAGRTLVVPATETEREIACAFAIRLSEAPWLAAAILDVEERVTTFETPLVTPPASARAPRITPPNQYASKRLSSQSSLRTPAPSTPKKASKRPPARPTIQGFIPPTGGSAKIGGSTKKNEWSSAPPPAKPQSSTPAPPKDGKPTSSRPPRKKTIIGLPAVGGSSSTGRGATRVSGPRSVRGVARASVRMVLHPSDLSAGKVGPSVSRSNGDEEEAFLLTRPVKVPGSSMPPSDPTIGVGPEDAPASHAVMRAAVRLLGEGDDEVTGLRRSDPPPAPKVGQPTAVALAWNGPLGGPVLRRAARLAHRVLVVVSSGMSVVELTRVTTRLGREDGVGYVLVNLEDDYIDLEDRVGEVEAFWAGPGGDDAKGTRAP